MTTKAKLYRTIWRWHFYAGVFCIPFVIALSVSGAIYLFKPQWEQAQTASLHITPDQQAATPNEWLYAAMAQAQGAKFQSIRIPQTENEPIAISLQHKGERIWVWLNPYTLETLQTASENHQLMTLVKRFHGELLIGDFGSLLVETAACWAMVLVLTGLYLWWPRGQKTLAGIVYPRLGTKGRSALKDWHAVIGFWVSLLVLFLLVSGLPWTSAWGSAFKEVRSLVVKSKSDWNVNSNSEAQSWRAQAVTEFNLTQNNWDKAVKLGFAPPVELSVANEALNTWKISSQAQNRPLRQDAWLDGDTGAVLRVKNFASKPFVDRLIAYGIAAHEGQLFGWLNQLLGLLVALSLVVLSVTGAFMWCKRLGKYQLGAPPALPKGQGQVKVVAVVFVAALFLPMLLLSLVAIGLLEWLVLSRIPRLNQWLGLSVKTEF